MGAKKPSGGIWGAAYKRHRAKGMDHADAAHRADAAVERVVRRIQRSPNHVVVGNCPTCGAPAQCIAGSAETVGGTVAYKFVEATTKGS